MNKFASRRYLKFAADGTGGGEPTPDPANDPKKDTITWKDPETGDEYTAPKEFQPLLGALISTAKKKERARLERSKGDEYRDLLQKVQAKEMTIEELTTKLADIELEKLPAEKQAAERSARALAELQKRFESESSSGKMWRTKFESMAIGNAIRDAIPVDTVHNQQSFIRDLTSTFVPTVAYDEKTGEFNIVLKGKVNGEEQELTPKDAVQKAMENQDFFHHLKVAQHSGGGTPTGGRIGAKGATVYDLKTWQSKLANATPEEKITLLNGKKAGSIQIEGFN